MNSTENNYLDEDGYPTEEFLTSIEIWRDRPFTELMDMIKPYWRFSDFGYWTQQAVLVKEDWIMEYRLSAGGWSGNESIIRALQNNHIFWSLCWISSHRGGHYVFEVKHEKA
ncbi:hypothetical protein EBS02_01895 [bacterium]|nr:hypothetical protein [bacterium]